MPDTQCSESICSTDSTNRIIDNIILLLQIKNIYLSLTLWQQLKASFISSVSASQATIKDTEAWPVKKVGSTNVELLSSSYFLSHMVKAITRRLSFSKHCSKWSVFYPKESFGPFFISDLFYEYFKGVWWLFYAILITFKNINLWYRLC